MQKLKLNLDIDIIRAMYSEGKSLKIISKNLGVSSKAIKIRLIKNNIKVRNTSESLMVSEAYKHAMSHKKKFKTWNKGLSKEDTKFSESIRKGRETQIANGKSKGINNPMWGRTTHVKNGYREDLGHFVRSSWEANFARILKVLSLEYTYEKETFLLLEGDTYTPDFYILSKDMFYEVKGWMSNDKFNRFKEQYPSIRITLVNERFYKKILNKFKDKIYFDTGKTILTKEEITTKYIDILRNEKKLSVSCFCKKIGISRKHITELFGSTKEFNKINKNIISNTEIDILKNSIKSYQDIFKTFPTYLELKKFFPRSQVLLQKYYNNKILLLKEDLVCKE